MMLRILLGISLLTLSLGCELHIKKRGGEPRQLTNPLPLERIFTSPQLDGKNIKGLKLSPDGRRVTYLQGKEDNFRVLDLWQWDSESKKNSLLVDSAQLLGSDKEVLSAEEQARRERQRISESGIVEYYWSKQGDKILFPLNGDLYLYTLAGENPVTRLTTSENTYETDPQFSPLGNYVSFVRDYNLVVIDLKSRQEIAITSGGTPEKSFATAEFVAQEEMGRYTGYWWSPDEKYIALTETDQQPVGTIKRLQMDVGELKVIEQKYPKAGTANAKVRLGVAKIAANSVQWLKLARDEDYLPHVQWNLQQASPLLSFQLQSRDQKQLELFFFDPSTNKIASILQEQDSAWVNVRHDLKFLKDQDKFIWVSEKSGYAHAYLYNFKGEELAQLTTGEDPVREILLVDEDKGLFYYQAADGDPREVFLWSAGVNGKVGKQKVTLKEGTHQVTMASKAPFFVDAYSSLTQPTQVLIKGFDDKTIYALSGNAITEGHPLKPFYGDLPQWELQKISKEGEPDLYYKFLRPSFFEAKKKYPLIQFVYGGPGVQIVSDRWLGARGLYLQHLAQQGYVVLVADNRGTPHRGRDFERAFKLKFGRVEVEDQAKILEHFLTTHNFVDPTRIGVFGHSYGGYLTMMLLFQRPELYKAGVAGAPVVDWTLYDTHYTERYLGDPKENEAFYLKANVLTYANTYDGRLLVVHGMADDNVLYDHSLMLYRELQSKGKVFDIMAYPGAKHGIRGEKRQIHYYRTIEQYFNDHLKLGSTQ